MVQRRDMFGGGLVAGIAALMAAEPAAAAQRDSESTAVARAVQDVRDAIAAADSGYWRAVTRIRAQQNTWMRANHSYPDFIEIGIAVWDSLHDWHVRYQHPMTITRTDAGRYVTSFMFTTLILRPDLEAEHVGTPFDGGPTRRP